MHAIQDVSPRPTLLRRLAAPLRRAAAALRPRRPARTGPYVRVLACVPGTGTPTLLTMRGADGVPFRSVEIGGPFPAPGPRPPESEASEPARRRA